MIRPRDGSAEPMSAPGTTDVVTTLVGRGHSGTRAYAELLLQNGFYMGPTLSKARDYVGESIYEAARLLNRQVVAKSATEWDFSATFDGPIHDRAVELLRGYLEPIIERSGPRGWKLPETMLVLPWLVRLCPDIRYVHWVRDPRDCILHRHLTDDLARLGAPVKRMGMFGDTRWFRALSWKYQEDLVQQTPKPRHWMVVRFEDFVLEPERTVRALSDFLDVELEPVPTNPRAVGRWKEHGSGSERELLRPYLAKYGYSC